LSCSMSVSSSNHTLAYYSGDACLRTHTPWLDIKCDNGLGGRLDLAGLLLVVLVQTLLLELLGLLVDFVVVATEQVELVVILLSRLLRCRSRVDGEVGGLRAVGSVLLGGVARKGLKLALKGDEVVVPAPCEWVLLWGGSLLNLLEDLDVGLRRGVAVLLLAGDSSRGISTVASTVKGFSEVRQALGFEIR
jgi:hypothetical protein